MDINNFEIKADVFLFLAHSATSNEEMRKYVELAYDNHLRKLLVLKTKIENEEDNRK